MLQQTRMEVVLPYFERFLGRFPDVAALAATTDDDVVAAWSGLGYYRRARMLRAAAVEIVRRFDGNVPRTVDELASLPGIGRYTAGAVASIAWKQRVPIVDGNIARIVARLFAIEEPLGTPQLEREAWRHAAELVRACGNPRAFNQALMEIGALICRPKNPSCDVCPLQSRCLAYRDGRTAALPVPKAKRPARTMRISLYVIRDARGRVLARREDGPLMHAMTHLPHGDSSLLTGKPLRVKRLELMGSFRHSITTRRIEFEVYSATLQTRIARSSREYFWLDPEKLADRPHPSYVKKALAIAGHRGHRAGAGRG